MKNTAPVTFHAMARREDGHRLREQQNLASRILDNNPILDRIPTIVVVLNSARQVVYYNKALLEMLGTGVEEGDIFGQRIGELIGCIHSDLQEAGCGTSEFCRVCGAVDAILTGLAGDENVRECSISRGNGEAMDLKIWAMPIDIQEDRFVILSITDNGSEKRRQAMERIFFHDILNTAGSIRGIAEVLLHKIPENLREIAEILFEASAGLVDEISWQKILVQAESGGLQGNYSHLLTRSLLEELAQVHANSPYGVHRRIQVAPGAASIILESDLVILRRVLGNMVKNALEAVPEQGVVTLDCRVVDEERICFSVHNPTFIPREVQVRIFRRSFSTKGQGRGLGTYSIKLLSQRYLFGDVTFTSSRQEGTTFEAVYPLRIPRPPL